MTRQIVKVLRDNRRETIGRIVRRAQNALDVSARDVLRRSITRVPVRSGRLMRSGRIVAPSRPVRQVWYLAWYAGIIEFGRRRRRATPYLIPAFQAAAGRFVERVRAAVRG